MTFAVDSQKYLSHVPLVTRPGPTASELIGICLSEFPALLPDRLVGDDDSTGEEELFHIAVAQAETGVEPDAVADDLWLRRLRRPFPERRRVLWHSR